jgi:hypothetical protein
MDEEIDKYLSLRERIVEQIIPMLDSKDLSPSDRFELASQLAQVRGSFDLYEKAFNAAQELGSDTKLNALMDLLGDVDIEIQDRNEGDDVDKPAPDSVPEASHHQ